MFTAISDSVEGFSSAPNLLFFIPDLLTTDVLCSIYHEPASECSQMLQLPTSTLQSYVRPFPQSLIVFRLSDVTGGRRHTLQSAPIFLSLRRVHLHRRSRRPAGGRVLRRGRHGLGAVEVKATRDRGWSQCAHWRIGFNPSTHWMGTKKQWVETRLLGFVL